MSRTICKDPSCRARAWAGEWCNYHALQNHRKSATPAPAKKSKKKTHRRAQELGIELADKTVDATSRGRKDGKVRSPVG